MLRWEGILIDPVGATIALLVFQFITAADESTSLLALGQTFVLTLLVGGVLGYLGGKFLEQVLSRYWVPDHLQTAVTLMIVVGVFTLSNVIEHESGLLGTTVMGIVLANQKAIPVRHLVEFKENLVVLLLSSLFILLAARLELSDFTAIGPESLLFLAALILIVRPATVLASTVGTALTWPERLFMMWMAPRGIVAASTASVFALGLAEAEIPGAEQLVPVTFVVIVGTCTIYGLTAQFVARRLKLAQASGQGALIVGAHPLGIAIGQTLKALGLPVLLVDTNYSNITAARMADLPSYHGNVLAEHTPEDLDLTGIGSVLALTPNDAVNAWTAHRFAHLLGRVNTYQLTSRVKDAVRHKDYASDIQGRILFDGDADCRTLLTRCETGAVVKATKLTPEFNYAEYRTHYGAAALPLFVWDGVRLTIVCAGSEPMPGPGSTVISLVDAETA